jgi:gliding motility-associated-like protein
MLFILCFITFQVRAQGPQDALQLDGFDDYVFFDYNNRGITNEVTVEAWVKTRATKLQLITAKYDRDGEHGYQLVMRDGRAAFSGRDGSGIYRISGYSPRIINDDKWHHLAGVCKNGTWSIYIDGILESQSVTGYASVDLASNAPFTVGNYFLVNNDYYQGQVDELKIWKKGLTEDEIRKGMCQKADKANPDLVVYLKFDEGTGSTLIDHSSYGINGTFRNMSPSIAWVTSSAPIGDKSSFHYTTNWQGQSVELQGKGSTFSAYDHSNSTQGFHIYHIATAPNNTAGITQPNQVTDYYGVFKIGAATAAYTVQYNPALNNCSYSLFRRADNVAPMWNKLADVPHTEPLTYTGTAEQGEFAFNSANIQVAKIQSSGNFCSGSTSTLSINTGGRLLWSTGETTKSISIKQAGEYTVTVTDGGCTYTDKITVAEIAFPEVNLGEERTLCMGDVAQLQAPAGDYTYKWSTGETTSSIGAKTSGTYWVEVTNSNGCASKDEIKVTVKSQPDIPLQQEIIACYGERVTLNATTPGASYLWSNGLTSSSIEVTSPEQLSVVVTVDGCSYTRQVTVSSNECPVIPNIITPNGDGKNDTFVLQGINLDAISIEIFNRWGTQVYKKDSYDNQWTAAGSGGGMYYYHIKSRDTQKVYKGWLEVVL